MTLYIAWLLTGPYIPSMLEVRMVEW